MEEVDTATSIYTVTVEVRSGEEVAQAEATLTVTSTDVTKQ